jgi:eukaryotic translation initiation factor 2C
MKPKRILFYRDGVGESSFNKVRSFEIAKIQEACLEIDGGDYKPLITFVVVQKRNPTR